MKALRHNKVLLTSIDRPKQTKVFNSPPKDQYSQRTLYMILDLSKGTDRTVQRHEMAADLRIICPVGLDGTAELQLSYSC